MHTNAHARAHAHAHPSATVGQGVLMGLSVFFINVEAWLVKRLINALTKEEGFFVPEFHPHPLFFSDTLLHHCDMCRAKTKQSYRCPQCDFDVCPQVCSVPTCARVHVRTCACVHVCRAATPSPCARR